jgi:hypothetical protein
VWYNTIQSAPTNSLVLHMAPYKFYLLTITSHKTAQTLRFILDIIKSIPLNPRLRCPFGSFRPIMITWAHEKHYDTLRRRFNHTICPVWFKRSKQRSICCLTNNKLLNNNLRNWQKQTQTDHLLKFDWEIDWRSHSVRHILVPNYVKSCIKSRLYKMWGPSARWCIPRAWPGSQNNA